MLLLYSFRQETGEALWQIQQHRDFTWLLFHLQVVCNVMSVWTVLRCLCVPKTLTPLYMSPVDSTHCCSHHGAEQSSGLLWSSRVCHILLRFNLNVDVVFDCAIQQIVWYMYLQHVVRVKLLSISEWFSFLLYIYLIRTVDIRWRPAQGHSNSTVSA